MSNDNLELFLKYISDGSLDVTQIWNASDELRKRLVLHAGEDSKSALHLASTIGRLDIVNCLMEEGADIEAKDVHGFTPLHYAVINDRKDVVTSLLNWGADINSPDVNGMTILHHAAKSGKSFSVGCLIERGADIRVKDKDNLTALAWAAKAGNCNSVAILLEKYRELGEDINEVDNDGMTAVNLAASAGHRDTITGLMDHGVDINKAGLDDVKPIDRIIRKGLWDVACRMIETGVGLKDIDEGLKVELLRGVTGTELKIEEGTDAKVRETLYSIIRLNNVEFFELLMGYWSVDYRDNEAVLARVDDILGEVYEEMRYLNLPLSKMMEFAVEEKLLNSRFAIARNDENGKMVHVVVEDVKNRVELIRENVGRLQEKLDNHEGEEELGEEFVLIARFVVQNIRTLKRQWKSSYDKLPWEEIEFCVAHFISSQGLQCVVSRAVLNREKIISYLENFTKRLVEETVNVKDQDLNGQIPQCSRIHCVKSVIDQCQSFKELYEDFEKVRTVYSLKRVELYVEQAVAVDLDKRRDVGKLVLERTLQVIGESLKNTLESPNVSDDVHELLIASAPRNLREMVTSVRDSLSHVHSLRNKMELEEGKDPDFFTNLQNDLRKVADEIRVILYKRNVGALVIFAKRIIGCNDMREVEKIQRSLAVANLGDVNCEIVIIKEMKETWKLIQVLKHKMEDQTDREEFCIRRMEEIVKSTIGRLKKAKAEYTSMLSNVGDFIGLCKNINIVKTAMSSFVRSVSVEQSASEEIEPFVAEISSSRKDSNIVALLCLKISCSFAGSSSIKAIDELKVKLEEEENISRILVDKLIVEFANGLDGGDKETFLKCVESEKEIPRLKQRLGEILLELTKPKADSGILVLECGDLSEKLNLTKKNAKKFQDMLAGENFKGCKVMIDNLRTNYQNLLNNTKIAVDNGRTRDIYKVVTDFFKVVFPKGNLLQKLTSLATKMQDISEPIHEQYAKRLKTLKILCDTNGLPQLLDKTDRPLGIALEMLVLDLTEILENVSSLADNRLFLDRSSGILTGKALRNYLAHGDAFIDSLPFDTTSAALATALRLVTEGRQLVSNKDVLVGEKIKIDLPKLEARHNKLVALTENQRKLFVATKEGDFKTFTDCVKNGGDSKARNKSGWTLLHFVAAGGSVEMMKYIMDNHLCGYVKDDLGTYPHRIATICGNVDALMYLYEKKMFTINEVDLDGNSLLHLAVLSSHKETVFALLEKGADVGISTREGHSALCLAARQGQKEILLELLNREKTIDTYEVKAKPLHQAILSGHLDIVRILFERGLVVDRFLENDSTPLHIAVISGNSEICCLLLQYNADANAVFRGFITPLLIAVDSCNLGIVKALLDCPNPASVEWQDGRKLTYLHYAAENGQNDLVLELLKHNADVNAVAEDGRTALFGAAVCGHRTVAQTLLEYGAKVDVPAQHKWTPLHVASRNGHSDVVNLLLRYGASVRALDEIKSTPLHHAANNGHCAVIRELVKQEDVQLDAHDESDRAAIHYAVISGHDEVVSFLILNGADVDATTSDGMNTVFAAAFCGQEGALKILLESNAKVDCCSEDGLTPLHCAAEGGHKNIVELLLLKGAKADVQDSNKFTPLYRAAKAGHRDIAVLLAKNGDNRASVNGLDKESPTPLCIATQNGHRDVVSALMDLGARVDDYGVEEGAALHVAASNGFRDIVLILLKKGANVNLQGKHNMTALHRAIGKGHEDIVRVLLAHGAETDVHDVNGNTPLHLAILFRFKDIFVQLLEKIRDVNARDLNGNTCLIDAVRIGDVSMVRALLDHGAATNAGNDDLLTPVHIAADMGHQDILELLLERGADVDVRCKEGNTPLLLAAGKGHDETARTLISRKCDFNVKNDSGFTPVHFAAQCGYHSIIKILIDAGADVNAVSKSRVDSVTALHCAVSENRREVVETLLRVEGINVNIRNGSNFTPLEIAVLQGGCECVHLLIAKGADVNTPGRGNCSPLHIAAGKGYLDIVKALLEYNARVDAKDNGGKTPLHYSAMSGHNDIVKALLGAGANVNVFSKVAFTPLIQAVKNGHASTVEILLDHSTAIGGLLVPGLTLHFAASKGHLDVVNVLLARGGNVDEKGLNNMTPLHISARYGFKDIAVALLGKGANVEATAKNNGTALHMAAENGYSDIVEVLLERGARLDVLTLDNMSPVQLAMMNSHSEVVLTITKHLAKQLNST